MPQTTERTADVQLEREESLSHTPDLSRPPEGDGEDFELVRVGAGAQPANHDFRLWEE